MQRLSSPVRPDWRCVLALLLWSQTLMAAPPTGASAVYTQLPEISPSLLRDAPVEQQESLQIDFTQGTLPVWIWGPSTDKNYRLRTTFELKGSQDSITTAVLKATCDNRMTVWLNGKQIAESNDWKSPVTANAKPLLKAGQNELVAEVANEGGIAAFILKLMTFHEDELLQTVVTNQDWQIVGTDNQPVAEKVRVMGKMGDGPWRDVLTQPEDFGRVPANTFVLLPGFQVEKLFNVPREEAGSWVAITFDPQGRLIVSDQGDKGLFRVTPAPVGSQEPTTVEKLNLPLTAAQGLLYAFDSLYVCVNQGRNSGLYRARDRDGDGQFEEVVKLKEFRGGGEHGPHALRLSPDGESIYVICGNHTAPPFQAGEEQQNPALSSRIPTNWSEDLILPRQWDANGHARGILAPGGWIAKTDPEGKTWQVVSMGYRNPYDMDFNRAGELFAYDADMEWDFGTPWYRPTRVVHATSGSEFGWRSGTGKWPIYYHDSLPPLVNTGPGSPVGVCFGYGANFPEKYEEAFYICDWTFGTIYAIHLEPEGASYRAVKEEFLSRSPLPLTDIAVGPDGAMYFTIGGRGAHSELYRVRYIGEFEQAGSQPRLKSAEVEAAERLHMQRRWLEEFHDVTKRPNAEEIDSFVKFLGHSDRHLRYAARIALEQQPVEKWRDLVLKQTDPLTVINGVTGLARQAEKPVQPRLVRALQQISLTELPLDQQLEYLRAWQLVFIRLGSPEETLRQQLLQQYSALFPVSIPADQLVSTGDWIYDHLTYQDAMNRELVNLLVYLQDETLAERAVALLQRPAETVQFGLSDLIARNRGYGGTLSSTLANQADLQQVHYAFALRNLTAGWTRENRKQYFVWFQKASEWSGGNSYRKFLQNISDDAFALTPEQERLYLEASGVRQPFQVPELPKAQGPGKDWTVAEVVQLAEQGLKQRNFENGKKMYAATRCIVCHRFTGEGGATGPDLTQLAGRFSVQDLTEAIILPSKVISDQYKAMQIITEEGRVHVGRVISETDKQLTVLLDPEDATKVMDISLDSIEEMQASQTSLMPADLLKPLNQDEVLDLLAFLLSRGDAQHPMFQK